MAHIEVRRLQYRGSLALTGQAEFVIGDALRTEVVDDGRLILVRSLPLGRIALRGRGAATAMSAAWRNTIGMARHGGGSDAPHANCVWFRDAEEARELLMRELARGRSPSGWFWPLAVPDWRQDRLKQYLEKRLSQAIFNPDPAPLDALIGEAIAAQCADVLASVIVASMGIPPPLPAAAAYILPSSERSSAEGGQDASQGHPGSARAVSMVAAMAVLEGVPPAFRAMLVQLAATPRQASFMDRLSRALVLRAHPALALNPSALEAVLAAFGDILRPNTMRVEISRPQAIGTQPENAAPTPSRQRIDAPEIDNASQTTADAPATGMAGIEAPAPSPIAQSRADPTNADDELRSEAAGLFLTIMPLAHLGWRQWLSARPDLLIHQPGIHLLRDMAAHFHIPATDPVWNLIALPVEAHEPPASLDDALQAWRAGLNGWLRRKARAKLAEIVLRRGWLLHGMTVTTVRFPMNAIDLRLRRLALDADPGWVDWLGHSYRIAFRDRPSIGIV